MITDNTDWLTIERIDIVISVLSNDEYYEYMIESADFIGKRWYRLVADDVPMEEIYHHFEDVHRVIRRALLEGKRVLVHCAAGVSRSVTLVAAYLMIERGISAEEALTLITRQRERANPNDGFVRQLKLLGRMMAR